MKKLLLLFLPVAMFAQTAPLNYKTVDHKVVKPPSAPGAAHDLDFTGLDVFGLSVTGGGGGGTPGGADRQLQFNNAFTFGGVPYATYDGTTVTFRTGARFTLSDPTDATKRVQFALANPTATLKTVTIADNSVTVLPSTAATNNFITGVNASGILLAAQPAFSNLSGTLALAQTSMTQGKLLGRYTASTGAFQEITPGANLTLDPSTGVLDAAGGTGTPGGNDFELQWNDGGAAFNGVSSLTTDGVNNVFATATRFFFSDPIDPTKLVHIDASPLSGGANVYIKVPSNSWTVAPDSAVANQFLTAITNGIPLHAQPAFSNLSGVPSLAQQNIPIGKERFVDPTNGNDGTGAANLAKPYLTIAGALTASSAGDVVYLYPNTTGYNQGTTPLVIPAGVTVVGAGPDTTVITGAVTGVTRAVVEPSTSSAIYNVTIQNTSSSGVAFGVGSASIAFTSAYIGGSKIIANSQGIYINKAGTTGLVVENTSIATQNDCVFQNISTATSEFRNCDLIADGTVTLTESKGLNVSNGTVRFNYGNITVGGATGTNVGAFASGSGSTIELYGVRISNSLGGSTNYDVQQQSSATVGVSGVFRPDAAAIVTNGTVTELSRYAVRDNNLTDFPNIGTGTRGDIIFRNATGWTKLAAGLDGNVLTTHGTTADPNWLTVAGAGGIVDNAVYGPAWAGITTTAPGKDTIYNYLHIADTDDNGKINVLDQVAGITHTDAAGVIQTPLAIPAAALVGTTEPQTLTNKRITRRQEASVAPTPAPVIDTDNVDVVHFTGINSDFSSISASGTPTSNQTLVFDFTDDGTPRTIAWDTFRFEASPGQVLPTTTTASTRLDVGFRYNIVTGKWRCLASSNASSGGGGTGTVTSVGVSGANGITAAGTNPVTTSGTIALSLPITLAGTAGKTLTVNNSLTLAGTDGVTLNIGTTGGTLGSAAFTASTAYLPSTALSDAVWSAAWNGDTTTAPSKNAIYDEIHTFDTNDDGKVNVLDLSAAELVKTNSSGVVSSATGGTDYANLAFKTVSVSGQSDVVADTAGDTLTLAAGSNVTITTTPGTDTVTIASTGGGGSVSITATSPIVVTPTPLTGTGVISLNNAVNLAMTAQQSIVLNDATTSGVGTPLILTHNTTGTPANGLGTGIIFRSETSTTADTQQGALQTAWSDRLDASFTAYMDFILANNTTNASRMRLFGSGGLGVNTTTDPGAGWVDASVGYKIGGVALSGLDAAWTVPQTISAGNVATGLTISMNDAVNNDATPQLTLTHNYNGGAGTTAMGSEILFQAEDSTSSGQIQASIESGWTDATHATRTANLDFRLINNAGALTSVQTRIFGSGGLSVNSLTDPGAGYINAGTGFKINNVALAASDVGAQPADSDLTTWAGVTPGTGVGTALAVNVGTAGAIVVNGGALGTPSGGTLTNATGLPIAGLAASTSTALGVGSIELGHATDTSLTRSAAGVLAVEGNKVNNDNPRVHAVASVSTTWTPNFDTYQQEALTALAGDINVAAPTATGAADGQKRILRIKADTTLRNLTWDSIYIPMVAALPLTVAASKTIYVGLIYNGNTSKWDEIAQVVEP